MKSWKGVHYYLVHYLIFHIRPAKHAGLMKISNTTCQQKGALISASAVPHHGLMGKCPAHVHFHLKTNPLTVKIGGDEPGALAVRGVVLGIVFGENFSIWNGVSDTPTACEQRKNNVNFSIFSTVHKQPNKSKLFQQLYSLHTQAHKKR